MISAVILSHDNASTIEKTLKSIMWCDERILVDDESHDRTTTIAKPMVTRILSRTLADDFAAQRNAGLDAAHGDWILFVDSDEVVSDALKKEIQQVIRQHDDVAGYFIPRQDKMWGRVLHHGETAHIRLLRLARKGMGKWIRPVHETWDIQGDTKQLIHPLVHSPHPDVRLFLAQINRYTTINAKVFLAEGKQVQPWQIVVYPVAKFFQNYIFRLGFLDGTAGFIMAMMMSFHSFLTRTKLWELEHT